MYHDRFTDFRDEVRELLSNSPVSYFDCIDLIKHEILAPEHFKQQIKLIMFW